MPRLIPTMWFRDTGMWNEPIFRFPMVQLSIRQMVYLFVFVGLAWMVSSPLPPLWPKLVTAVSVVGVGMGFFGRPGKTFSPEWYCIWLGRKLFGRISRRRRVAQNHPPPPQPSTVGRQLSIPEPGEPARLAGLLADKATGARFGNQEFEVLVDGKPYHMGRTDSEGWYSIVFAPPGPGNYRIGIRPVGSAEPAERIELRVVPKGSAGNPDLEPDSNPRARAASTEPRRPTGPAPYVYELIPLNFVTLPDEKQDRAVDRFRDFLNSLGREIRIHTVRSSKTVEIRGQHIDTRFNRFFIESPEPLDTQLATSGLSYQRAVGSPEPNIVRTFRRWVALEGGRSVQTATVCALPESIVEGFLSELYGNVDRVTIKVRPLRQDLAVRRLAKFSRRIRGAIYAEAERSRTPSEETRRRAEKAQQFYRDLVAGGSRLFEVTINLSVAGSSAQELRENIHGLQNRCRARLIELDEPMLFQPELLRGALGSRLTLDTKTAGALYPFVSSDVIEPGGLFLGVNEHTGGPVAYDFSARPNQNVTLVGVPGAGKSFLAKILLHRMLERFPDLAYFVVDPEGEYREVVWRLGGKVAHVSPRGKLGLDPLTLFSGKSTAADTLAEMLGLKDPELGTELRKGVMCCPTLEELVKWVSHKKRDQTSKRLRKYLEGLLQGPEGFLVGGNPIEISDRMCFNFKELHKSMSVSPEGARALHLASLLLFARIWHEIERMPRQRPKLVIVDEVWLYAGLGPAATFLEQVSRRGRKRNVHFVLASQQLDDVLKNPRVCTALKNSATKVIFQQDETTSEQVSETFLLSPVEQESTLNFQPGEGILIAPEIRSQVQFITTQEEYPVFSTRPREVAE